MTVPTRTHLLPLAGIRIILALYIVLFHTIKFVAVSEEIKTLFSFGFVATDAFFVLSGFVLTYAYSGKIARSEFSHKKFIIKRISKLYPLVIFSLFLFFPWAFLWADKPLELGVLNYEPQMFDRIFVLLSNIFLLDAWNPLYMGINFPCWSISALFFMYFCFPFICRRLIHFSKTGLVLMLLSLLTVNILLEILPPILTSVPKEITANLVHRNPIFKLPLFVSGIIASILLSYKTRFQWESGSAWSAEVITTILISFIYFMHIQGYTVNRTYISPLLVLLVSSLSISTGIMSTFITSRAVIKLSEISLSIFIIHIPLWRIFRIGYNYWNIFIQKMSILPTLNKFSRVDDVPPIFYLIYLISLVFACNAIHALIVTPVAERLNKKYLDSDNGAKRQLAAKRA